MDRLRLEKGGREAERKSKVLEKSLGTKTERQYMYQREWKKKNLSRRATLAGKRSGEHPRNRCCSERWKIDHKLGRLDNERIET